MTCYALNIKLGSKPVKQQRRNFHPEIKEEIEEKIQKLIDASFMKLIKHPIWLANIVLIKKKNDQMRICINSYNLNKAYSKDEFPLSNMDILIDFIPKQDMLSFMYSFNGYNQIKMASKDAEKTLFRIHVGNFYYTVMPFRLKKSRDNIVESHDNNISQYDGKRS